MFKTQFASYISNLSAKPLFVLFDFKTENNQADDYTLESNFIRKYQR